MPKKNIIMVVAILVATALTLWLTRGRTKIVRVDGEQQPTPISKAIDMIRSDYYLPIEDDDALERAAIRGAIREVVGQLDEFSSYFSPDQKPAFQRRIDGLAEGLGLRASLIDGHVVVTSVAANSPARAANIRPGMQIAMIDSIPATKLSPRELSRRLNPPAGKSVTLAFGPPRRQMNHISFTSAEYDVQSVRGLLRQSGRWQWILDAGSRVGYVRIVEFVNDTAGRVQEALRRAGPIDALVLDLRSNPGGKSDVAIQVADLFLDDGLIVQMVGRAGIEATHEAHSSGTLGRTTMVVLVDEETASGAELLAGALWAQHRAVIVGVRTRGKGCVQSMIDLGDMGLVNLTTSQFVFSRGGPITRRKGAQTWGLQPHVKATLDPQRAEELKRLRILAEYGPKERATTRPSTTTSTTTRQTLVGQLLGADAQLRRALELIRKHRVKPILTRASREARREALARSKASEAVSND